MNEAAGPILPGLHFFVDHCVGTLLDGLEKRGRPTTPSSFSGAIMVFTWAKMHWAKRTL